MQDKFLDVAIAALVMVGVAAYVHTAARPSHAGEQVRFYAPDGRSAGTATPLGDGSTRYYDASGRSTGTSTTSGNATTVYDSQGRVIGRAQRATFDLVQHARDVILDELERRHDLGDALPCSDLRASSLCFVAHGSLRSGPVCARIAASSRLS